MPLCVAFLFIKPDIRHSLIYISKKQMIHFHFSFIFNAQEENLNDA